MPPKRKSRIYGRTRGAETRYYGDFRDYADVGGKREPLVPRGGHSATTDPDVAKKLVVQRLEELEEKRRRRDLLDIERETTLAKLAGEHLRKKARARGPKAVSASWLDNSERMLRRAIYFFGAVLPEVRRLRATDFGQLPVARAKSLDAWADDPNTAPFRPTEDPNVAAVSTADVQLYVEWLGTLPNGRGGTLGGGSIRHHLTALSNLYGRAASEGYVQPGYNPVAALMDKPAHGSEAPEWFEVHDAALYLEAVRLLGRLGGKEGRPFVSCLYPLVATLLLTGGRESEITGLDVEDVSFDRRLIYIRPNEWRRLKTRGSERQVPLWPQLEEILRPYVFGGSGPRTGLLFRSDVTGGMITDIRKALDAAGELCGYPEGAIRTRRFRHTYTSARLQTLDGGAPVSPWTVAREMGHATLDMVNRVYGHLGTVRHRAEVVEYRVEQHSKVLGERLVALRAWEGRAEADARQREESKNRLSPRATPTARPG